MVIALRSDLIFTPQMIDGQRGYVIEDPLKSKFYRVGIAEYKFISVLDGLTSVADALRLTAATLADEAFTQDEAATICKWLVDSGLAHTPESAQSGRLSAAADKVDRAKAIQRINPICVRLPLVRPDRFLNTITPWVGWLFGPWGATLAAVIAVIGGSQLIVHAERFGNAVNGVFAPGRWIWLGLTWLGLKIIHEIAHGVVCKRYGGSVREGGLMFILLAPLAYVDVTSSWRFSSKWHRIYTAAAGMYIELLVASLAAIVWSQTDVGLLNDTAFNLVIMASLTTLVFNANPLMRFDGYYILSDLLQVPNLYPNGQQYLVYLGRRYLLGVTCASPRWCHGKDIVIKVYGVAAMFWRIVISLGLILAAAAMFAGAGIVLAVLATVLWLGMPMIKFARYYFTEPALGRYHRLRFCLTAGSLIGLSVLLFTVVPWPGVVRAPAVVDYSPLEVVRAGSAGFVAEIEFDNGQFVRKGDVLVRLQNEDLEAELANLKLEIEDVKVLCRVHQQDGRLAAYQAETKHRESLEKQLQQKQGEVDQLIVRAPISGQAFRRNLGMMLDSYLSQGAEIASIGNRSAKEIQISVAQDDLESFLRHLQRPVTIRIRGNSRLSSTLDKVSPRASMKPLHDSLCAPNGGPLAVRRQSNDEKQLNKPGNPYELLAPRFLATVHLSEQQSAPLWAGQRGVATFWDEDNTIGKHLFRSISRWIRKKTALASSTS